MIQFSVNSLCFVSVSVAESCNSHPCKNNGTCINMLGYYECLCATGWGGRDCEIGVFKNKRQ